MGVIGDSISDEYRFFAPDRVTARNWVEVLSANRGLDFGGLAAGGARCRGFANNWAQSGATSSRLIAEGQHTGLAAQVAGGGSIGLAAISVGTNDFADVLFRSTSVAAMESALDRASSNLDEILDLLLGLNPTLKIAAFTAADLRPSPLIRGVSDAGLISEAMSRAYGDAVATFNQRLRDRVSAERGRAVVVDIGRLLFEIVTADRYVVGSVVLDPRQASNDVDHLFLGDGFHPGTIGQCLMANWFLDAVNSGFDANIPLLGGDEIVRIARAVPKPSGASLIGSGVLALFGYGRRQGPVAALDVRPRSPRREGARAGWAREQVDVAR